MPDLSTPPDSSPTFIDARGLMCPLPVLRLQKVLRGMELGQQVEMATTDPATASTIADFCRQSGHRLVTQKNIQGEDRFTIEKGAEKEG